MSVECKRWMDCAYTLESFLCQSYIKQGPFVRDGVCPRGHLSGGAPVLGPYFRGSTCLGAFVLFSVHGYPRKIRGYGCEIS